MHALDVIIYARQEINKLSVTIHSDASVKKSFR